MIAPPRKIPVPPFDTPVSEQEIPNLAALDYAGHRLPVTTAADLDTLDTEEVIEGYRDGRHNEPCGDNRSRSYWHGWRNGRADGGHAELDYAQRVLAQDVAPKGKTKVRD
jgi:hypothetical protein